ncbi:MULTISPECIES: hypothetical protein [Psychrobacillus]|uniref:Lipoprotein n=1 Tax=Psychrobacillus faecigallinarum TaxID=2762235 RepID=A0ABR8R954_9BACI|nr:MULTISPECIES: hypothetical protein [Psychrobacillus]MBD7944195.1 hypothetical protein [Psychrobacillus faecigallinarum]QGM31571.1 hypothetical protein GI482_14790 [Bacillus sp. N3536]
MFAKNKRAKIGAFSLISLGLLGACDNDSTNKNDEGPEDINVEEQNMEQEVDK